MRILFSSNAPWSCTGYGVQSKYLLPRLAALPEVGGPEAIAIAAWFGLQGGETRWGPFRVLPGHAHPYGVDVIGHHARAHGADVVLTLIDAWTQRGVAEAVRPALWLPWFPVDGEPLSRITAEALAGAALPLVYSRWGLGVLAAAGIEAAYVPHAVEPAVFRVLVELEPEQLLAWRQTLAGAADVRHLAVMVAANKGFPDRKAFQVQLRAWAAWSEGRPGCYLYVHTDPTTQAEGIDLLELVRVLGIEGRVRFPDRYQYYLGYPDGYLALVYNAADVLLAASMTEGFGLPILEAQACGTPVIVTDYASMPELLFYGELAPARDRFWSPIGTWWAWPDHDGIVEALERNFEFRAVAPAEALASLAATVSAEVHGAYGWDVVVEKWWRPVLEKVGELIG